MSNKGRRNIFRAAIILSISLVSLLFFQNCGGAISSQASISSSQASGNSNNGTSGVSPMPAPTPAPLPVPPPPAPSPGGQTLLAQTVALRKLMCNPFINTSVKASFKTNPVFPSELTLNSGAGNGGNGLGNGDSADNTVRVNFDTNPGINGNIMDSQNMNPPANYIQNPKIKCAFTTAIGVDIAKEIVNGVDYRPSFTKAIDIKTGSATFGQNIAQAGMTADELAQIALRTVNFTATAVDPVQATTGVVNVNLQRDNDGLRCVNGYFYIRLSVRTQTEADGNQTAAYVPGDSNYRYVKINVVDQCWDEKRLAKTVNPIATSGFGFAVTSSSQWVASLSTKDNGRVGGVQVNGTGTVSLFKKDGAGQWGFCEEITVPSALNSVSSHYSVALTEDGKLAIGNINAGNKSGAVHLYYNGSQSCAVGGWTHVRQLTAGTGSVSSNTDQNFGSSLAFTNNRLVIGASRANANNGAVYLYKCTASDCTFDYALPNSHGINAGFGSSVALDGNMLVVGAPQRTGFEDDGKGFVQIFDIASASAVLKSTLSPTSNSNGMRFGHSVAVKDSRVLIGAPFFKRVDNQGVDINGCGAAYYYDYNKSLASLADGESPAFFKQLTGAATANLYFGSSVALDANGFYVGSPGEATREGRVFYYSKSLVNVNPTQFTHAFNTNSFSLFSMNKTASDDFGYSMSVVGSDVVVGAAIKAAPNKNGGAVYVFKKK